MKKEKLKGKDLAVLGYENNELISLSMQIVGKLYKREGKEKQLVVLKMLIENPQEFLMDTHLSVIANKILEIENDTPKYSFEEKEFVTFGGDGIEKSAKDQMKQAMSLPISVNGALMPDAHHGYGLPIGGVLATENAIIPYGVGVDIGCRMCLTVFDAKAEWLTNKRKEFKKILEQNTKFGDGYFDDNKREDSFFDRDEFLQLPILQHLKDRAYKQIGSSGGGNHFVEFGAIEIGAEDQSLGLTPGKYIALLSHSGSRGFGANIAGYYTDVARKKRKLPKQFEHLSWLYMDESEGQEYWLAMNMAGDYASACHHHIHKRISKVLGYDSLLRIENHHNFAWKETLSDGKEVFVHRKGATPAKEGELGIIPGSMTLPAFIVKGKGHPNALFSASHGAGRLMSRTKAKEQFTLKMMREELGRHDVELIGGGLDESPFAYKNIHEVMKAQDELVEVIGAFYPKIVRME
jgi:tRNA-splicing ligase RtcB (3'-phosphate/5'-hydroxy nucleic acid ligase)